MGGLNSEECLPITFYCFISARLPSLSFLFFQALLKETERLVEDKLDLQRQSEKDQNSLMQRLRALERELEEQETKGLEMEHHHKSHTEDLNQRVQALEKQLKHDRQFIEVTFEFKIICITLYPFYHSPSSI